MAAALARRALLPSRKQQLRKDDLVHTLLFDMDGVLANVSESYVFLDLCHGLPPEGLKLFALAPASLLLFVAPC